MHCADCATWLPSFQPSLVLVSLGANDGAAASAADYQALVRALHGIGARVAWVEPPAGLATANAARDAIASLGVPTVPATRVPLGPDGVHPVSYAPWAREIARGIG
jgi:lysophospholipase L1-like esterase